MATLRPRPTTQGYTVADTTSTTVAGVGLSCDTSAHYIGTAVLSCDGTTFSSPHGCELQGQCGDNPACPAGYEKRSTDPADSYCAGTACDLVHRRPVQ